MKKPIATITADIHARATTPRARNGEYLSDLIEKLRYLNKVRGEHSAGFVPHLDAGDLFHTWKSTPEVEVALIENLPRPFLSIPGNHEIPYHSRDRLNSSSFYVLYSAGIIRNPHEENIIGIPYGTPFNEIEYFGEGDTFNGFRIALYHGMVWEDKKPDIPGIEGISARDLLKTLPAFDLIISGHNHESFIVTGEDGRRVLNPGSVMRSSIDQVDHVPAFSILYDDGSLARIPFKCREDVFNLDRYAVEEKRDERIEAFVSQLKDAEGFSLSFEENVRKYCGANNIPDPVRAIIDKVMEE